MITTDHLQNFLATHKIMHNKFEVNCLIWSLDIDGDGSLNYSDYLRAFMPREKKVNKKKSSIETNSLGVDVEYALTWLLSRELEMHWLAESLKTELIDGLGIDIGEAYFYVLPAKSINEYITDKNMWGFLGKRCGLSYIEDDVKAMMKRMTKGSSHPNKMSVSQFVEALMPLHLDWEKTVNWILKVVKGRQLEE
jgi:hypothetical protein